MTMRDDPASLDDREDTAPVNTNRAAAIDWAFRGLIVGLSVLWLVTLGVSAARGVDTAALVAQWTVL